MCRCKGCLALCTMQVHGPQCLRCTYLTIRKVSARDSCCTAVRDAKAYAIQRCQVGEPRQQVWGRLNRGLGNSRLCSMYSHQCM